MGFSHSGLTIFNAVVQAVRVAMAGVEPLPTATTLS